MRSIYLLAIAILLFSCNNTATTNTDTEADTEETAEMTAASANIPEAVKAAFAAAHPDATEVEWEVEGDKYEAEYELGEDHEMTDIYNADGSLYATEVDIEVVDLPNAVSVNVGGEIKEACKITLADGTIMYEVGVNGKDYLYRDNGALVSEEMDDDSDDDDDKDDDDDDDDDKD